MFTYIRRICSVFAMAAIVSACNITSSGNKEIFGTLLGGAGGAVVGSQFGSGQGKLVGVAIGTLAGAFLGNQIGISLDRADQIAVQEATQRSLETQPTGVDMPWQGQKAYGSVKPISTFQGSDGRYCREYQTTITVAVEQQVAYGTACRQPDGSWQVVSS